MKAVLAVVIAWTVLVPEMVTTAQAAAARASRVSVSYVPPKDPAHQAIYEQLKQLRFLEKLQLNSSRRSDSLRALLVKTEGCDGDANAFYEYNVITVCYEYIDQLWKTMPAEATAGGVTPIDAIVGALFDTCLHEFGHALFDLLRVPVSGREEDAADQVVGLHHAASRQGRGAQTDRGPSPTPIRPRWRADTTPLTMTRFADVHGTPAQRFYNVLCIAYGADAQLFGDMVAKGYLPKERAEDCKANTSRLPMRTKS